MSGALAMWTGLKETLRDGSDIPSSPSPAPAEGGGETEKEKERGDALSRTERGSESGAAPPARLVTVRASDTCAEFVSLDVGREGPPRELNDAGMGADDDDDELVFGYCTARDVSRAVDVAPRDLLRRSRGIRLGGGRDFIGRFAAAFTALVASRADVLPSCT